MTEAKAKLHVAFNMSIAASIRQALQIVGRDESAVGLPDDLSFGPINAPVSPARAEWVEKIVGFEWSEVVQESDSFWRKLKSNDATLIAWVNRHDSAEYCGFLEFIHVIGELPFKVIDVTEIEFIDRLDRKYASRSLGLVSPEQMLTAGLFERARPLNFDEIEKYRSSWAQLKIENAPLRIVTKGALTSAPIDYFDNSLMLHTTTDWSQGARVVGGALEDWFSSAECPHVSDIWLWGRVCALAEAGILETTGDAAEMRKTMVRRTSRQLG